MNRVLIIKLGYQHDIPNEVSRVVSLGSVLRSTVLLHLFENSEVTWVTSRYALPLIKGAKGVTHALSYDSLVSLGLTHERFDIVVNLEAAWEFCALAESISAAERFGFALDKTGEKVIALKGAEKALAQAFCPQARRKEVKPYQQTYYDIMGGNWQGEPLVLGYKPAGGEKFDVGFNMHVGERWQNKDWPMPRWEALDDLLTDRYTLSYQDVVNDLPQYLEWLNSCKIVVSNDSLGLYAALALGKKVVGLFGPTSADRCHVYGRGLKLIPIVKLNCIPCYETQCRFTKSCIATIRPEAVADAIDTLARTGVLEK
jgi:heptosyltransferase-2